MRGGTTVFLFLAVALTMNSGCGDDSMMPTTFTGSATGTTPTGSSSGTTSAVTTGSTSVSSDPSTSTTTASSTSTSTSTSGTNTGSTGTSSSTSSTSEGETSGSTGEPACEAPGNLVVCDLDLDGSKTDHAFAALGVGCKGAVENTIPITGKAFKKFKQWKNPESWRVAAVFGSADDPNNPDKKLFRPREGERFLVVSSGRLSAPDDEGVLVEAPGSQFSNNNNANDDTDALAAPLSPELGSNGGIGGTPFEGCDGVGDCSDSIWSNWTLGNKNPNDQLSLAFDVKVPAGVHGFLFDFVFFSSEYPDFVGAQYNDMLIAWSTSEAYTGNVTFFEGEPLTVTSLAEAMENSGYIFDDPALADTGFEGHASTGWATAQAPVLPLEEFTFALAIMDMGDSNKASAAIIDNWRWDCVGCVLKENDPECGSEGHPPCCGICIEVEDDPDCGVEGHPPCCPEPK